MKYKNQGDRRRVWLKINKKKNEKWKISNICLVRKNNTIIKSNKMLKIVLYWAVCLVEGIKPLSNL